jgi:hypothetical protein
MRRCAPPPHRWPACTLRNPSGSRWQRVRKAVLRRSWTSYLRIASDHLRPVADLKTALQLDVDRARHNLRALLGPAWLLPYVTGRS